MEEKQKQRGRPRGTFKKQPEEYKNRFQKFYYKNRMKLSNQRRELYRCRRIDNVCVRCGDKLAEKNKLFCKKHSEKKSKGE